MLSIICARKHGAASARRGKRRLLSAALCACFLFTADPAAALTREEAAKVAELIAALQPAFSSFAYDEEIVGDWFERDAAGRGLIRAAGFTAESWKTAVGETFHWRQWRFEVVDMDGARIDRILIAPEAGQRQPGAAGDA